MIRRTLPLLAAAAAAFALVPGTASAAPGQAPPQNAFWADYSVSGLVELSERRQVQYSLVEHRDAHQDGWSASLSLSTWTYRPCGRGQCQDDYLTGHVELDAEDVLFDRNLSQASVTDVPVMMRSMGWSWPGGLTYTDVDEVVVSLQFDASGKISRSVYHGDLCSDGQTACQANRLTASRTASGTVTVDAEAVPASTTIQYMQSAETAPKLTEGGTQPPPPADGNYPPLSGADGGYPPPPADGGDFGSPESTAITGSVEVDATN